MEIVRSLNRSWIDDTCFSLYRPIHPGEKTGGNSPGEMSGYPSADLLGPMTPVLKLGTTTPQFSNHIDVSARFCAKLFSALMIKFLLLMTVNIMF